MEEYFIGVSQSIFHPFFKLSIGSDLADTNILFIPSHTNEEVMFMERDHMKLNRLHIHGLQNYYELEAGTIPSKRDIQETINRLKKDRSGREERE